MSEFAKNVYLPMGGEERHDRRIKEDSMVLSLAVASREHEEQVSICVSECEISHAVCGPTALHGNLDLHGGGCLCIFRSHYWRYGGSIHRIYHYHFLNLLLLLLHHDLPAAAAAQVQAQAQALAHDDDDADDDDDCHHH